MYSIFLYTFEHDLLYAYHVQLFSSAYNVETPLLTTFVVFAVLQSHDLPGAQVLVGGFLLWVVLPQ